MDMLPDALVAPGVEVVGDGLPGREVVGQHPPGAAATRQVQDGIDNLPYGVSAWPAGAAIALGKQMFDVVPLGIRQITGIALPCKSIHAQEDNIDWHARERLLSRRPVRGIYAAPPSLASRGGNLLRNVPTRRLSPQGEARSVSRDAS